MKNYEHAPMTQLQALCLIHRHLNLAYAATHHDPSPARVVRHLITVARLFDKVKEASLHQQTVIVSEAAKSCKGSADFAELAVQVYTLREGFWDMLRNNDTVYRPSQE